MTSQPYRPGAQLDAQSFRDLRRSMVLDHCKWDPQVGDVATLANFPLLIARSSWSTLASWAETLAAEALAAETELLSRPELHRRLGLPWLLRRALATAPHDGIACRAPRALRFDFHFASEGWRISECNADVPGGYAEASAFAALMAEHYSETSAAGDPGAAWASAIAEAAGGREVALLSAPGFMEDQQVVNYLAKRLRERGVSAYCAQPAQIEWREGGAMFAGRPLGALLRFYQAEWLPSLPRAAKWWHYLHSARTPVLNPGSCILIESKRFPLVWDDLVSTRLAAWRKFLPATADPRAAPWRNDDGWLLKTALCNTGDSVSIKALMQSAKWTRVARSVQWSSQGWVAQRRFEAVPLETPLGPVYPCIGVYTVDGRACGAYARLSHGPIVDYAAIDVALLIEDSPRAAVA
ncbi:MAG TPA: glutathionylspermidine synthase family protein [Polyangiaceae bacterium]|nr:glutathionylspermidine synthase family protein [Polyangiaceae bacterium]